MECAQWGGREVRVHPDSLQLAEVRITKGGKIWEGKCVRKRLIEDAW